MPDTDFKELMRRAREGSEDAAWELVEQYGGSIRRAVRRLLGDQLRSKFDSLDFVQLVWNSFFRVRDKAERFDDPNQLAAFLATVARNKVRMEIRRRLMTEKYNVRREQPLGESTIGHEADEIVGRQPEPPDVAIARERWDQLLENQPAHYRRIIQLKLQGHTCGEIGAILDLDEETVRRFLKRLLHATPT